MVLFFSLDHFSTYTHFLLSKCFSPVVIIFGSCLQARVFASVSHLLKPRCFSILSSVFSQSCRIWTCGASPSSVPCIPTASMWTSRTLSATLGKMQSCSWPSTTRTSPRSSGSRDPGHLPSTLQKYPVFTYLLPEDFFAGFERGRWRRRGGLSRQ